MNSPGRSDCARLPGRGGAGRGRRHQVRAHVAGADHHAHLRSIRCRPGRRPQADHRRHDRYPASHDEHPNWVGYFPTTYFKVPPNATVRVTIDQQDGASGLRNEYLGLVRGTVGNSMTVYTSDPAAGGGATGKTMQAIDPTTAAHTFSVPDLGVSVPLLGSTPTTPRTPTTSWSSASRCRRPESSTGSASCRAARARCTATAARCRRWATWTARSRWGHEPDPPPRRHARCHLARPGRWWAPW